jgi:hypothetical protein
MNLLRLISRSQRTRPTSVVYGEGEDDVEEDDDMARAEEAAAAAASGPGSRRGMERRRGATRTAAIAVSGNRGCASV